MIKIVSGHNYATGALAALVNFCNQFNARGYPAMLYGPGHWHLGRCKAGTLADFRPEHGDIILVHDICVTSYADLHHLSAILSETPGQRMQRKLKNAFKHIFSSGNPDGIKLYRTYPGQPPRCAPRLPGSKTHVASMADAIASKQCGKPQFACPSFLPDLRPSKNTSARTAAVIGDHNAAGCVEAAIERAMRDGMERVTIYGYLADPIYFYANVISLTKKYPGKIKYAGFVDDAQTIYDSVSDVYPTAHHGNAVARECRLTGTRYHGPEPATDELLTNDQIFEAWKKELKLSESLERP
jgi:hypothetical protein